MSAPLYGEDIPDPEDFVVCHLQPLLRSAVERGSDDTLPFALVTFIDGDSDPSCGTSDPVVQVDIFGLGVTAAKVAATDVNRRMELLDRDPVDVVLSDGSTANADFCNTLQRPRRMDYAHDEIVRYTARYQVGLSYVTVTS